MKKKKYKLTFEVARHYPPRCLNCGGLMTPVKDEMTGKKTGYLWRCKCMPKGITMGRG